MIFAFARDSNDSLCRQMTKIAKQPSLTFLLLTFSLTYLVWIPLVFRAAGSADIGQPLLAIGWIMPGLVTVGLVLLTWEAEARRDFLLRVITLKGVRPLTFLIILIPAIILLSAVVMYAAITRRPPSLNLFVEAFRDPLRYGLFLLNFGILIPVSEELGWRGYLLDHLRRYFKQGRNRYMGDVWASAVIGSIVVAWHLPLFYIIGTFEYQIRFWSLSGLSYAITTLLMSLIYTWQYHVTRRNILLAILFHLVDTLTRTLIIGGNVPLGPLWNILTVVITALMTVGVLVAPWGLEFEHQTS